MSLAYSENPKGLRFQGQEPDEQILLVVRAHLITNLSWIFIATLILLVPYLLDIGLPLMQLTLPVFPESFNFAFFLVDYLLVTIVIFEGFLNWYYNVNIITVKRIIDVNFYSLLRHEVVFAPIERVEEANATTSGILGTLFNFGDVSVQTAGARVSVFMHSVPSHTKIAELITEQSQRYKGG